MTRAIGEALAGARDAGRVARELDAFVGVWDAPRSRHAAALVMAGDGDRVAPAARALAASSRARVLWAAEPVDWRAVKRHLRRAAPRRARARRRRLRGADRGRRGAGRAYSTRCGRRLLIWASRARRRSRWATRPSSGRTLAERGRGTGAASQPSRRSARAGVPTCRTRNRRPFSAAVCAGSGRIHVTLAALDRGGELVRHLRVLADGVLLELEAHGDGRRFVGRVERPREAGGLCCVTNCMASPAIGSGASLSMRAYSKKRRAPRSTRACPGAWPRLLLCSHSSCVSLWEQQALLQRLHAAAAAPTECPVLRRRVTIDDSEQMSNST